MQNALLVVLVFEALLIFFVNGKNIVSPSFIACMICIFSVSVYALSGNYYQYDLHFNTVLVVSGLILALFVGEMIIAAITRQTALISFKRTAKPIVLPIYVCIILEVFVAVVGVFYFRSVYSFSLKVGNTPGNYFGMAYYVRTAEIPYESGVWISQGRVISDCILYFFTYYLFYNKAVTGKFFWRYVWLLPAYAIHILAADNRTTLLQSIVICVIIIFFILKQKSSWSKKNDKKIVFWSVFAVALYFLLFRLLGYRTNFSGQKDLWHNLVKYSSSGLMGLDKYLNGEIVLKDTIFGERILMGIYGVLRSWGFADIPAIEHFEPFYYFAGASSNIYSGFKSPVQSFGIVGAVFFFVGIGMLLSVLINSAKYNKFSCIKLFLIGLMVYPIVMLPIDGVYSSVLTVSTLYKLVYLTVIIYVANIFREKKYDRTVKNALA
ncbi:MAG: O-antigen polymerase [Clostridia bacterium]|nr:O-antigen polymerase [Clostridia bacterium]